MLSQDAVDEVMTVVLPGDFWDQKHELIARAIGSLVAKNEPTEIPEYTPTPWESLDKLIGGFSAGQLVVAARPGSGKTIECLQIAAKLAHSGMVAFSSLEMSGIELQSACSRSTGRCR